jgi:prophage regulatory protein
MRVIRPNQGAKKLGVSLSTYWRYAKSPEFPVAFRLGPNAIGWDEAELDAWLESRRVVHPSDDQQAK